MMDHKLIDGRHYEDQYADTGSPYFRLYVENGIPNQAKDINQYYVDYAIWMLGLPPKGKVLEAGCGVGHKIHSWERRGFDCIGIEVSRAAKRLSSIPGKIVTGNVSDLSMFADDEFDLVFSHGLMEHIDDSVLHKTVSEMYRVGLRQFHVISIDKGVDPGHIQVLSPSDWIKTFGEGVSQEPKRDTIATMADFVLRENREIILVVAPWGLLPYPVKKYITEAYEVTGEPAEVAV